VLEAVGTERAAILRNLFELYCYDFSEQLSLELKPNGRFDIALGDEWWTRNDHFAFLIRHEGKLVGFALVRKGSRVSTNPDVKDVAEFFVARGARRRGIGTAAARALFETFPGAWEIRIRASNAPAQHFWARVVEALLARQVAPEPFSVSGVAWNVLRVPAP
jgi:predicted acetyltransferase